MLCSAHAAALGHTAPAQPHVRKADSCGRSSLQPFRQHIPAQRLSVAWRYQLRGGISATGRQGSGAPVASEQKQPPSSAEEAVNGGLKAFEECVIYELTDTDGSGCLLGTLQVFQGGRAGEAATRQALALFETAMTLQPSRPEARAALYNAGCCHVKLKQWQQAILAVEEAINKQGLKLKIAQEDEDLAPLRERREWLDALGRLRGGITDKSLVQLRSEAKAPLRLTRLIFGGGLLAGAAVGLVIIIARLVQALQGGEGAPEVMETLKNLGINSAAVLVLGWIVRRDLAGSDRDKRVVQREEALARLQVAVSGERVLPLASFRGATRPVLLAGSRSWLQRTMQAAEPYKAELRERGVSLVPLNAAAAEAKDPSEKLRALKREFRDESTAESKGFGPEKAAKPAKAAPQAPKQDRKWQLEAFDEPEWLDWISAQLKAAGVAEGENVYVQISLDGTVRTSGVGLPPWERWLGDLAPLDDVRSRLTKQ